MFSDGGIISFLAPALIMGGISLFFAVILVIATKYLAEYGPCRISVNKGDKEFEIMGGESLLSSLLFKKIFIPSACGGRGSCGYCKLKVPEGGGMLMPTERPYLSHKELDDNMRLACQVKVKNDMEVEVPEEYLAIQEYKAAVKYSKELTYDIKEIRFKLIEPGNIKFKPGQYIQFHIPSKSETIYRAYSISSQASTPDEVELIVRLVPGGTGSTYIHNLKEGDEVTISGPYGEFYLQEDSPLDIVCVGGGAGMAPLKAIIYSLFAKGSDRKVDLYFGVRATEDLFYIKEFDKLKEEHPNFNYCYALSSPGETDDWDGEKGFIHLVLEKLLTDGHKKEAYLCGPPIMIDAVIKVLTEKEVKEDHIYFDKF
ncbi:MAG: FAD-binding oxidoreductase [bacterium]|nr:FAD-binding oxidoreductase [bacterium]